MNRREFLKVATAGACAISAWGGFPFLRTSRALADTGAGKKLLIVNFEGGLDGLYGFQPNSGPVFDLLHTLRPTLALAPEAMLPVSGGFSFHPGLVEMRNLFNAGDLLPILNVGYQTMSRSHEEASKAISQGVVNRLTPTSSGFVSRLGAANGWSNLRAVSVAGSEVMLQGEGFQGLQVWGLDSYNFWGAGNVGWSENLYRKDMLYSIGHATNAETGKPKQAEILGGIDTLINSSGTVKDAVNSATFSQNYPDTNFGQMFRDADILFSRLGTEVACIKRGGFDSHSNQSDTISPILSEFSAGLAAFVANMKSKNLWDNTIVLVISEFGRTNLENDSGGTDHGGANTVFLMGGGVQGGQIFGNLTNSDLTAEGWLPMKFNIVEVYRQLFANMGYDPDRVFERVPGASLGGLFG